MAQEFNLPNSDDPDFNKKVLSLLEQLFKHSDNPIRTFSPIGTPSDNGQHGDVWFDQETHKLKVRTSTGVQTVKFE